MKKTLTLITIGILVTACPSPKMSKHETMAYKSASPENREKIEQGILDVGMSIKECKASHPDYQFVKKFSTSDGSYELWQARGAKGKDLYLHVENGKIKKVSENTPQTLSKEKQDKDGHQFFNKKNF